MMYYLDEIMDRTFDNFAKMVNANNDSFWTTNTTIEAKPTEEPETATPTTSPTETPAWEPADTTQWRAETSVAATPMIQDIADTARDVIEEINPFTDTDRDD